MSIKLKKILVILFITVLELIIAISSFIVITYLQNNNYMIGQIYILLIMATVVALVFIFMHSFITILD